MFLTWPVLFLTWFCASGSKITHKLRKSLGFLPGKYFVNRNHYFEFRWFSFFPPLLIMNLSREEMNVGMPVKRTGNILLWICIFYLMWRLESSLPGYKCNPSRFCIQPWLYNSDKSILSPGAEFSLCWGKYIGMKEKYIGIWRIYYLVGSWTVSSPWDPSCHRRSKARLLLLYCIEIMPVSTSNARILHVPICFVLLKTDSLSLDLAFM